MKQAEEGGEGESVRGVGVAAAAEGRMAVQIFARGERVRGEARWVACC